MAKQKKSKAKPTATAPPESSRSVAATVAWMLTTLTTLVAMLAVFGLQLAARAIVRNEALVMLSRLLLFAAAMSGLAALLLLVVTWQVREDRPPLAIVVASVVIGVTPLVGVVFVLARAT